MKHHTTALLAALPIVLIVAGPAPTRSKGILPSTFLPLTRSASASCGACHGGSPGGPRVTVHPTHRSLQIGQTIPITVAATGGPNGNRGGMAADVTGGRLIAGNNTQTSATGKAITHQGSRSRSWTFNYQAPTRTGPAEFYTVVNAVNGNGKTSGDQWAFHGADPTATVSTPVRFFVNAPGVVPIGRGCADGYGNVAVHGAAETPTVGNANFKVEAIGLPPAARVMFILGLQKNAPSVDLSAMGAPGCFLHSDFAVTLMSTSTPGDARRAEGRFVLPMPVPNVATLKGFFFRTQVAAIDASPNSRRLPVVFTNGLGITIQ